MKYVYEIKEEVKDMLKQKNITQEDLADIVGIGRSYINQILNGRITIPKRTAYFITKAISSDFEIDDIFYKKV